VPPSGIDSPPLQEVEIWKLSIDRFKYGLKQQWTVPPGPGYVASLAPTDSPLRNPALLQDGEQHKQMDTSREETKEDLPAVHDEL
jgi:hypothetical protein